MKLTVSKKEREAGIKRKICELDNGGILCVVNLLVAEIADYQRDLSERHLNEISANHNDKAQRLPLISFRDNVNWKVDGNHTSEHLIKSGKHICHAVVFFDMSYEEEAELFYLTNKIKKRMAPWIAFKAAIQGCRSLELRILKIVKECKLTTPLEEPREADLRSTSVLYHAINGKHGSEPHLRKLLTVLRRTWRVSTKNHRLQAEARNIQFQRGLHMFLVTHPNMTIKAFVDVFGSHSAAEIQLEALRISGETGTARADQKQVREALEYFYDNENFCIKQKKARVKSKSKKRKRVTA